MNKEQLIKKWLIEMDYKLRDIQEIRKAIDAILSEPNTTTDEQRVEVRFDPVKEKDLIDLNEHESNQPEPQD